MKDLTILIGGDLVPTESNQPLFMNGDIDTLFGSDLLSVLDKSDCRIFNLEVPFTDHITPIKKHGPNLRAPTNTIKGIAKLKPTLMNLANNHILDQDKQGLRSTLELLNNYHIATVGADQNLKEASIPFLYEKKGIKVGVYACADHEFSIATEHSMGANPFDPLDSFDHIYNLKKTCDYVIILYHGGKEHYRYPSPYLQKVCRKMVDKGADLIVCQHSHCIGCYEEYHNGTIVYGQGNFIFDASDSEYWRSSLLLKIILEKDQAHIQYLPIVKYHNTVRLAEGIDGEEILTQFKERSLKLLDTDFIEKEYRKFADTQLIHYLKTFRGGGILFRILNRVSRNKLLRYHYNGRIQELQNYIECDAHRELLLYALRNR